MSSSQACKVVVLLSGSGSNLQALIDRQQMADCPFRIVGVISNRPDAYGIRRAQQANIAHTLIDHTAFCHREAFDRALINAIDNYRPDLIALAGFMRILTPTFVQHYAGRLLNIHPSLLPKYQGLNTHQRVLDAGDKLHGVTVHFVTEELDGGPAIIQAIVAVDPQDTATSLSQRVQQQEHRIYPQALEWFANKRLALEAHRVLLDGQALSASGYQIDSRLHQP
ncbi:MAG: phosphoribosylglycinamide formyltransferase [Cellvibrionaceae bacterium]|nr:phosphoribosylglycinamide formyltransferase [Cellvibrionaceae bacterium]